MNLTKLTKKLKGTGSNDIKNCPTLSHEITVQINELIMQASKDDLALLVCLYGNVVDNLISTLGRFSSAEGLSKESVIYIARMVETIFDLLRKCLRENEQQNNRNLV